VIILITSEVAYSTMGVDIGRMDDDYTTSDLDKMEIEIVNVSATFEIEGEFDRAQLHEDLSNTEYDPEKHRSLIYRGDAAMILLPPKGRVSIVRATTPGEIKRGVEEFTYELRKLGIERDYSNIQIENVVGTANLGEKVDLNSVTIALGLENAEYEPEQFPGVIYRIPDGSVVLIFSSGKIVITKAETYGDVVDAYEHTKDLIVQTLDIRE
jgi:transcription initiation factor TFIID TATA-box-binding protein